MQKIVYFISSPLFSKKVNLFLIFNFFIAGQILFAQNTDSLQALLKNTKEDTNKVNLANEISKQLVNNGDYKAALKIATQALELSKKLFYKKGESRALKNLANAYMNKGDYPDALKNYLECLKIREKLQDKEGIANVYHDIAQVYDYQGISDKALENYELCLKIKEGLKDENGIANVYTDIGTMYDAMGSYGKALRYYMQGLKIREEINDSAGLPDSYVNIGIVYKEQGNYKEALTNYERGLLLYQKNGYTKGVLICYNNMGEVYRLKRNFSLAQVMLSKAVALAHQIGSKSDIKDGYEQLTYLDTTKGNYKFAFRNYINYILYRDSLTNEENTKKTLEEQFNYDIQKKEAVAKAEQDKKDAIAAAENRRQRLVLWLIALAGFGTAVFALLIYRSLQQNKKAKKIIEIKSKETEEQKHLVEEKQKEIIDSITYAKRLQQAILPAEKEIKNQLPESFIYYQPKDIVAGDFYWMHTSNDSVYIAAADCTGHGVPGAMVSVVCSNALNRAVKEFNLSETGEILDKTRELVIETFEKSDSEVKDGMDISLLRIKKNINQNLKEEVTEVQWSGANNSLWYILDNELIEVKADKQPIGKYSEAKQFTTNNFQFDNSSVAFYLFSDGYADQFSPDDKKLMKKKFKDVVLSSKNLSMINQKEYIEKVHVDWKGDAEQTDDVLVIGIKI